MSIFMTGKVRTAYQSLNSVTFFAPKIWEQVSKAIKYCTSLKKIIKLIKSWVPKKCLCRRYKTCIAQLGFISS